MANARNLSHSEKRFGVKGPGDWFISGEKARDRADALRQIEGLNQQDKMTTLLAALANEQFETNRRLEEQTHELKRTNQLLEWLGKVLQEQNRPSGS